jgi:hypothetical protein
MSKQIYMGCCFLCRKRIYGRKWNESTTLPRRAGTVKLWFGYGSIHDICGYDGFICDACVTPALKRVMLKQTKVRLAENRKRLIKEGVQFMDFTTGSSCNRVKNVKWKRP